MKDKIKDFFINLWESFRDSGCLGSLVFVVVGLVLFHSCSYQEEKKYDEIYQSAYEEGYNEGYRNGEEDGKWFGYYQGYENGYDDRKHNRKYDDDPPY